MTFTEIVTEVSSRLNLTSPEALLRIGREVNARYRRVTTTIGLVTSRRATVQANATIGVSELVFTGIEKVINVVDRSTSAYRVLSEVTVEQLRAEAISSLSTPTKYAVLRNGADNVTVLLDCVPLTAFTLYADGHSTVNTLSGTDEPAFAESFHDVLVQGVLADEYRKLMKLPLAKDAEEQYAFILSDLRMFIAKSAYLDITQGGRNSLPATLASGGGSGSGINGAASYTQTGLINFDRSSVAPGTAPFAVAAASAGVVTNLNADLLDGLSSSAFLLLAGGTMLGDLKFTDGLYDIGKSGATRPRDVFLSRDLAIGRNVISDLLFTDATFDIGKVGATRPRDLFLSRNLTVGGTLAVAGTTTLTGNIISDVKFTDATFDIGKTGATRPRDVFISRNVEIGGTAAITGVGTFTAQSVHSAGLSLSANGQIVFPATQNASAGANTLDDYEELTWTPSDGSGAGLAFTVAVATYIKIGQLVVAQADITYPVTANGANATIAGLPFTTLNAGAGAFVSFTDETTLAQMTVPGSGTTLVPRTNAGANLTNVTLSANRIIFTAIYRATA